MDGERRPNTTIGGPLASDSDYTTILNANRQRPLVQFRQASGMAVAQDESGKSRRNQNMAYDEKHTVRVSILVKALNEERLIARCLAAAVREARAVDGEVILVDSLSTDRTVEVARSFPVRIVQFARAGDRCCGAAVQLGYQFAAGEYLYVVDGDMELQPGFIECALALLEDEHEVAGVGGRLVDTQVNTTADERRSRAALRRSRRSDVDHLSGGGLYRRTAVESVGYLAHRWLPAFEEAELGFRLRAAGWRLIRVPELAVLHTGHSENDWGMMRRLWYGRRHHAAGLLLRSAIGHGWFGRAAFSQWPAFVTIGLHSAAVGGAILVAGALGSVPMQWVKLEALAWAGVWMTLAVKKRSFLRAGFAALNWHLITVATMIGACGRLGDPREPVAARELT